MSDDISKQALDYHEYPSPGKLSIHFTKPMETQRDLSLAYTPGVAEPVRAIAKDPDAAYRYTSKGNLVAVITNGTAVLGLGDVGALASKPVMEGKCALFKKYANIDAIDIEVDAPNPSDFVNAVARIATTFGGINLEDIKAPECFEIEHALRERLKIPVFHDDQHGTAIVVAAALLNALELQNKRLENVKIVCLGAGAAGLTTMHLLLAMGASRNNIYLVDRKGVVHSKRQNINPYKFAYAIETDKRTLAEAVVGADVFIGLSGPDIFKPEMLQSMADKPIVFALSNPDPEINPELAYALRDDLIMATGRSDFPNQVNNVLAFPYIFRAALDVRAYKITTKMKIAAAHAIAKLAKEPIIDEVKQAYPNIKDLKFGPYYLIPKPIDPRLLECVTKAVAEQAIKQGVARQTLQHAHLE